MPSREIGRFGSIPIFAEKTKQYVSSYRNTPMSLGRERVEDEWNGSVHGSTFPALGGRGGILSDGTGIGEGTALDAPLGIGATSPVPAAEGGCASYPWTTPAGGGG